MKAALSPAGNIICESWKSMRLHENDGAELQQITLALINLLSRYCLLGKTGERRGDKNHEMIKINKINTHECPLRMISLQRTRVICSGFRGALRAALIDLYSFFPLYSWLCQMTLCHTEDWGYKRHSRKELLLAFCSPWLILQACFFLFSENIKKLLHGCSSTLACDFSLRL